MSYEIPEHPFPPNAEVALIETGDPTGTDKPIEAKVDGKGKLTLSRKPESGHHTINGEALLYDPTTPGMEPEPMVTNFGFVVE